MNITRTADCLVVGAGPAGLTAALYLRRYLRDVVVVHHGHSRALAIKRSHNFAGFPEGISGEELLQRLRQQLAQVKGELVKAAVTDLQQDPRGGFIAQCESKTLHARTVLLATGLVDIVPALLGVEQLQQRGLLRQCPICDGYEHRGQRVVVLGDGEHAAREAAFIAHYSLQVAHVGLADVPVSDAPGVRPLGAIAERLKLTPQNTVRVGLADGSEHDFDIAYAALGVQPRSDLARAVGARVNDDGNLVVDAKGATGVPGLYAAGDVVEGLGQLVVAASQGALAATAIHQLLRQSPTS